MMRSTGLRPTVTIIPSGSGSRALFLEHFRLFNITQLSRARSNVCAIHAFHAYIRDSSCIEICSVDGTETIGNFYMQQFNDARSNLSETLSEAVSPMLSSSFM